jgi:hypothetical protein
MATSRKNPVKKQKIPTRSVPPHPFKRRLQVPRLHVEDQYPAVLIASQFGIRSSPRALAGICSLLLSIRYHGFFHDEKFSHINIL